MGGSHPNQGTPCKAARALGVGRLFPLPSSSIALKPPDHQFSSRPDSWAAQRSRFPYKTLLRALVIHESFGQAASLPCSAFGKGTGRMLPPSLHPSHCPTPCITQ